MRCKIYKLNGLFYIGYKRVFSHIVNVLHSRIYKKLIYVLNL